jgi:hypothetical protein
LTAAKAVDAVLIVEFHDQPVVALAKGVDVVLAGATVDE